MKRYRLLLAGLFILLSTGWMRASTIQSGNDPRIIINGGQKAAPVFGVFDPNFPIKDLHFEFMSPTGTSPGTSPCVIEGMKGMKDKDCLFTNDSGARWISLTFDITTSKQMGTFTCKPNKFFNECFFNSTDTQVTFLSTLASGGIPANATFQVKVEGWHRGVGFAGTAAIVPEPGTLALVALGLGVVAGRRRLRHRPVNRPLTPA